MAEDNTFSDNAQGQNGQAAVPEQNRQTAAPHKRRKHYSGKYPKHFEEKYKELDPKKYEGAAAHILAKGGTPAGTHVPIMVREILDFLQIAPGQTGLDCTLGYGGHTRKMLDQLQGSGHLYSLDADPIEIKKTEKRLREAGYAGALWTPIHENFRNIDTISALHGPFDFVLADLGVSSMQIDDPSRGFSWKADGPLDLRFDPEKGESAADRLASLTRDEFEGMLVENSDEPYAADIARTVMKAIKQHKGPETTAELRRLVDAAVLASPLSKGLKKEELKEAQKKSNMRVFQALRIDVNSEFEVLYEFLEKLPGILVPGGKAAILTFHSGEDRLVKKSFKALQKEGLYSDIAADPIRPGRQECHDNPRSHSTKFRWAIKA